VRESMTRRDGTDLTRSPATADLSAAPPWDIMDRRDAEADEDGVGQRQTSAGEKRREGDGITENSRHSA